MGRKNSPSANKELNELIAQYETAKAENRQLYLDADQLADIADWYASERKFEEAQEVITYGLKIHPGNTALLIEQAYLYLDTQKLQKAKKVADSIPEDFDSEVKLLKAELLLNGGKLEEAQWLLSTIADADELETWWAPPMMSFKSLMLYFSIWTWDTRTQPKNGSTEVNPVIPKMKNTWLSQPIIWHRPTK